MNKVELYSVAVPQSVGQSLRALEREFDYPLGPDERFRIDHGPEYGRFYSSMGESACVVVYDGDEPCATVSAALRTAAGAPAVYGGDLKVHPRARGGKAYHRAASELARWTAKRAERAYSVVMGGTAALPDEYSGRAGLPALRKVAGLTVFSLAASPGGADGAEAPLGAWERAFGELTRGCVVPTGGEPARRSSAPPRLLLGPGGAACGRLEDTREAKKLLRLNGTEIKAAHLASFAFRSARSGVALARRAAALSGAERLFFCVPESRAAELAAELGAGAPAAVYATGDWPAGDWIISSSEI
ncbi:MAG: hypothetical protein HY923_02205 [Elusimicrobia bacterium]|nr:hypothetical protein [Elusimicrobiota bacterium]